MKSYQELFAENNKALFIPFFVLGDPDFDTSLELIKTAIDAGADLLELGIAFSDPIADGPTIQRGDVRALASGMTCVKAFELIAAIKAYKDIPIGLLMYYNLIVHYGVEAFYRKCAEVGVNSVLVADLCIDDADELTDVIQKNGLDSVFMVTPNTTLDRQKKIAELCTGFIYTVSLLGVTGARSELSDQVKPLIASLKAQTDIPICVGFGVSRPEHVRQLADAGADGVIVGSALVNLIEENLNTADHGKKKLTEYLQKMKGALQL